MKQLVFVLFPHLAIYNAYHAEIAQNQRTVSRNWRACSEIYSRILRLMHCKWHRLSLSCYSFWKKLLVSTFQNSFQLLAEETSVTVTIYPDSSIVEQIQVESEWLFRVATLPPVQVGRSSGNGTDCSSIHCIRPDPGVNWTDIKGSYRWTTTITSGRYIVCNILSVALWGKFENVLKSLNKAYRKSKKVNQ